MPPVHRGDGKTGATSGRLGTTGHEEQDQERQGARPKDSLPLQMEVEQQVLLRPEELAE